MLTSDGTEVQYLWARGMAILPPLGTVPGVYKPLTEKLFEHKTYGGKRWMVYPLFYEHLDSSREISLAISH